MPLRRLRHFANPLGATGLFAVAVLVLTTGLYVLFDFYLDSVGREIATSWLQSEAVAIQEGNLLSSISKNQRVLLSSQFVKGVRLIDTTTSDQRSLIEFGESIDSMPSLNLQPGQISVVVDGILAHQVLYRIPGNPDLVLNFKIQSDFLTRGFLGAVAAFMLFLLFLFVTIRKVESRRIAAENKNRLLLGEVAARVAHDIRSPLNTLNAVLETIKDLPPNSQRLLTTAIQRIRDIASGIGDQSRLALKEHGSLGLSCDTKSAQQEPTLLLALVEELVAEKRAQYSYREGQIQWAPMPEAHVIFALLNPIELKRSLSNLIDNAIEASSQSSSISVTLSSEQNRAVIEISDQGSGIPSNVIARIGEKGFSFGKENGTGLGVHYARRLVESWGGTFILRSTIGKGSSVRITLPKTTAPIWYTDTIQFDGCETVLIVDDDPTIHALWQDHLRVAMPEIEIEHFFEPNAVMSWIVKNRKKLDKCLVLTDYNLNSPTGDGISVIERFGLVHPKAIMVTSAFDDLALRESCERQNVKILPKPALAHIAIQCPHARKPTLASNKTEPRSVI